MDHIYKKSFDDLLFINQSITVGDIEDLVKERVWKKNETLYFVDFPSNSNPGYECMTTKDSYNSNKPCSFPFYWRDQLLQNCSDQDTGGEPWCYTKVNQEFKHNSSLQEHEGGWGLCRPGCQGLICFLFSSIPPTTIMIISGQKFVPSNVHNLAQYEDQWTSEIYDLRSWYDGYCHTFDPKETQPRSLASKLSLFLGHRTLLNNYKGIMFKQFTLVLTKNA